MKKILRYSLTAFLATAAISFAAPDKETLITKEKAAWQAFKDKKQDDFQKIVSASVVGLYADGVNQGISGEIDGMKSTVMKSFDLSDFKIAAEGDDVAIATYVSKIDATIDGKDASGTFNSATVWQKQGGEWHAIFHTNVKQQPAK